MSCRPYLESGALRQMYGLPEQAFEMLVTLLARICDHPYDPVFSAPAGVPRRRAADVGDFGFIVFGRRSRRSGPRFRPRVDRLRPHAVGRDGGQVSAAAPARRDGVGAAAWRVEPGGAGILPGHAAAAGAGVTWQYPVAGAGEHPRQPPGRQPPAARPVQAGRAVPGCSPSGRRGRPEAWVCGGSLPVGGPRRSPAPENPLRLQAGRAHHHQHHHVEEQLRERAQGRLPVPERGEHAHPRGSRDRRD